MKIIENNWWLNKEITYKGNKIIVPVWTNWIAVYTDGNVMVFSTKPLFSWEYPENGIYRFYIGKAEFEASEDWKESLEFVGEEQ